MPIELDPGRLEDFAQRLKQSPRRRVEAKALWSMFAAAFPGRPQAADERRWFLACLEEMQSRGLVRLPSARGRRWDRALGVAVPSSVDVVSAKRPIPDREWRTFPWHPSLSWVADLRQLTDQQLAFLQRVHEGLVQRHFDKRVPVKYRSLQLFGDEKGLDRISKTQLFGPGKLDLEQLGCLPDVVPIPWESVSDRPAVLIFENAGPFSVAREVLAKMQNPTYGMVGYGGGTRLESSIPHLLTIGRPIKALHYVGDLDIRGLQIAAAARQASLKSGLTPLAAAPGMHKAMLESCKKFGYPNGWPVPDKSDNRPVSLPNEKLLDFLPGPIRGEISAVLSSGRRVPEEVLGPEEMEAIWNTQGHR